MTEAFSPTLASADFAAALQYDAIPAPVVDRIKRDLLDWIGCSIAGSIDPASKPIRAIDALMGGPKQAGVFGAPKMTDMRSAAMMNAYYSHIMEMDDVDRASISHPASCIFPAVLALAGETAKSASGKEMLASVVAGFEVMLRIGAAVTPAHYKVFHTTATTGVFGGAAASARLLGLNAERTAWAIGNAGTSSCGLWQFNRDGAMSKFIHTGYAASNGLFVALLAREGFSGPIHVLEGEQGFFVGYARQDVNFDLFRDFGKFWRAGEISFKPYPCCRHTHSAIDAAIEMHKLLAGEAVKSVKLHTYNTALNIAGKRLPTTERQAKFSITYCVASAMLRGGMKQRDFEGAALQDPSVLALQEKIEVIDDPAINACVPKNWPCRLEVETVSGRTLTAQVQSPTGDPEADVSWAQLEDKFRQMTEAALDTAQQDEIIAICRDFESLPNLAAGDVFAIANRRLS